LLGERARLALGGCIAKVLLLPATTAMVEEAATTERLSMGAELKKRAGCMALEWRWRAGLAWRGSRLVARAGARLC